MLLPIRYRRPGTWKPVRLCGPEHDPDLMLGCGKLSSHLPSSSLVSDGSATSQGSRQSDPGSGALRRGAQECGGCASTAHQPAVLGGSDPRGGGDRTPALSRHRFDFWSRDAEELRTGFARPAAEYEALCREQGIEPEEPYSGQFLVRASLELHRVAATAAARQNKSLKAWVTACWSGWWARRAWRSEGGPHADPLRPAPASRSGRRPGWRPAEANESR